MFKSKQSENSHGARKILLSGVKPTGRVHIGNYFGAMKQFVDLQDKYNCNIFIADYHAMTTVQNKEELKNGILDVALDYLAIGLDPKKVILFKQSDISEVTELTWIFNCLTTVPYLQRAHAYKDSEAKGKDISAGLFDYPVLMASDILIQDADIVPVGQDQKQHLEFTRDFAQKFNNAYGETFKLPEPFILPDVETIPGIDGKKMSKSYDNVIPLFASDDEIKKLVMSIATDSKGVDEQKNPDESILFAIHKLVLDKTEVEKLRERYSKGGMGWKEAKELLIKDLISFIKPMRKRRENLSKNIGKVLSILKKGGEKAKKQVKKKMKEVREKVGVEIY